MARLSELDRSLAKMGIKPHAIPLERSRPSITRSDALSGPLHEAGLGIPRLVAELESMLHATMVRTLMVKSGNIGGSKRTKEIEVPDYRTRLAATQMLTAIHGYAYAPQKAQDQHPLVVILNQLPEEIRQPVEQSIENRLKTLLKPGAN